MCFYLEHNKKLHFKCLCLTWPTTRDNINTKFLTGPCPTNPRPSPPMLMGSAVGAADKMKDENALQHWRGARAAKIEVRGDAKDLVLISSRLGRRTLSEFGKYMFSQYLCTRVIVTITRQLPPQDAGVPFFTHTSGSGSWVLVGLVK